MAKALPRAAISRPTAFPDGASGAVVWSVSPFPTTMDADRYALYAGEMRDSSGLYYLRARWYDPLSGRLISRDMIPGRADRPGTLNAYSYAAANPIMNSDPSGDFCIGLTLSGTATFGSAPFIGSNVVQASVTGAFGAGVCVDSGEGLTVGGFNQGGAFVKTPVFSASTQPGPTWAWGAFEGVGPNFFSSNARRVSELKEGFDTVAIDTQFGSLEYAESGDVSVLTAGVPLRGRSGLARGAAGRRYTTYTNILFDWTILGHLF